MVEQRQFDLEDSVRQLVMERLFAVAPRINGAIDMSLLAPGKMVRTKMAAQIWAAVNHSAAPLTLTRACAAIELLHSASLCHDDVIDDAPMRRHRPALWRISSKASAVLIGDLLLCSALELITVTENGRYLKSFLAKTREVCEAEAEQELVLRGKPMDDATCLRIARSKTGPLFAFCAEVCEGKDDNLAAVLEEVGYGVGTVYQLADDVLDVAGSEAVAGKTLGTDAQRGKLTLAQRRNDGLGAVTNHIRSTAQRALALLTPWPAAHAALTDYFTSFLQPVLDEQLPEVDVSVALSTAV